MTGKVYAPFSNDQVRSLNSFQISGVMHPFTCARCRDHLGTWDGTIPNDRILVATNDGWMCPTCDTTQDWAWGWMADWTWEGYKVPGFNYPPPILR